MSEAIDLLEAVEARFGVAIEDAEAESVSTVADLETLVRRKLPAPTARVCLTASTFYRLRAALLDSAAVGDLEPPARSAIRPGARVEELLPRAGRRAAWRALERRLGLQLPMLHRPRGVDVATVAVFAAASWSLLPVRLLGFWSDLSGWVVCCVVALLTYLAVVATEPLATRLPERCGTVGDTAGAILAGSFGRIAREKQAWTAGEVRAAIRATVADELGVPDGDVRGEARLVEDLGFH